MQVREKMKDAVFIFIAPGEADYFRELEAPSNEMYLENILRLIVELGIDFGDLTAPAPAFGMAERRDLAVRPMGIIRHERNLLVYFVSRIKRQIPASRKFTGISIGSPQCGQTLL